MITTISKQKVLIDDEHKDLLDKHAWHIETGHGYVVYRDSNSKKFYLHRIITKAKPDDIVDHINRNKLDNRMSNLRLVDKSINALNTKTPKDNTSGYKGVSWSKEKNTWRAYITKSKKQIDLGTFQSLQEAAAAYKGASKVLMKLSLGQIALAEK